MMIAFDSKSIDEEGETEFDSLMDLFFISQGKAVACETKHISNLLVNIINQNSFPFPGELVS